MDKRWQQIEQIAAKNSHCSGLPVISLEDLKPVWKDILGEMQRLVYLLAEAHNTPCPVCEEIATPDVNLSEQLKAARRELSMRENAYPRWVQSNKLTQKKADNEIAAMKAIINTLEQLSNRIYGSQTQLF